MATVGRAFQLAVDFRREIGGAERLSVGGHAPPTRRISLASCRMLPGQS